MQEQAREAYRQFKQNPAHPSLHFKQVHPSKPIYSVRITGDYRGSRNVPRPDNAQVTNSDPYPGPRYGHSKHPTVKEQERGG